MKLDDFVYIKGSDDKRTITINVNNDNDYNEMSTLLFNAITPKLNKIVKGLNEQKE